MGALYDAMMPPDSPTFLSDGEVTLRSNREEPKRFDAAALMEMQLDPITFVVPEYCVEGLTILAGRAKLGKSWLALDWLLAVSSGGVAMGIVPVEQGDCLYLALEDGPRRLQSRILQLSRGTHRAEDLERMTIWTEAPRLDHGLLDQLGAWAAGAYSPRLIVIDVFARVRPASRNGENPYDSDYRALGPVQQWATRTGTAVLLLHHTRKAGADDPLEMISGTNGLAGAADTVLVLNRDANGATLYVRGRDIGEKETALEFDQGQWLAAGDAGEVRQSRERLQVLSALEDAVEPLGPSDIAKTTGMKASNVRVLLYKLGKAGQVRKVDYGKYALAHRVTNPGNTDNAGNGSAVDSLANEGA